ncbi:cyclophilin-like protein, partial [Ascodesmis nigricans]
MSLPRVFLDLSIGGTPIGRIIIELFIDQTPVTCENFRRLCTSSTIHPTTNQPLTFTGTLIHRIVPYFVFQGGDVTSVSSSSTGSGYASAVGTGGHSALGTATFADENLHWRSIDAPGLVCMANRGPGTNSSQFFVTLHEDGAKWLTGRNTVFGRVVEGMEVVRRVER